VDHLWNDAALPEFDVHCPLLSLPMLFKTTLGTIPSAAPSLLHADPKLSATWRQRVESEGGSIRIGLAWAGRAGHARDRARSVPLSALSSLGRIPGVSLFSLQKGPAAQQVHTLHREMRLIDWTAEIHSFGDTAALIEHFDLIITVDTAVAHLAGAMGKPVWVLLPIVPDWRWMLNRSDSPWYPTMRLFRQPKAGDWVSIIADVARMLGQFVAK
jgi:Glycosyltransferase family 9 (heptosyltransferase)